MGIKTKLKFRHPDLRARQSGRMGVRVKWLARIMIAAVACGFIVYGTFRGEVEIVLNKAVNICLECIGLG